MDAIKQRNVVAHVCVCEAAEKGRRVNASGVE